MSRNSSTPDYERLFGTLDVRPADDSRSVFSPAAYLVELLRLLDEVGATSLLGQDRRSDIADVPLNGDNTLTELRYLDVVNDVLERVVGPDPYGALRQRRFPFDLPFSLPYQRLRRHLVALGVDPVEFARLFATPPDPDVVARERLGIASEEADVLTVVRADEAGVRECFGLAAGEQVSVLTDIARFRRATGLTAAEVPELLWQRFGHAAPETAAFFVHQGVPVIMSGDGTRLVRADESAVSLDWYDRVSRFVRLARRTALSLTDLDLVLRTCCGNLLDGAAQRVVAVVLDLRDRLGVPVDVVCSFAAPMDVLGLDATTDPTQAPLFARVFDPATPGVVTPVIRPVPGTAPAGRTELTCVGDVLAPTNRAYRRRVAAALGMTESDVVNAVTLVRAHYALPPAEPSPFDRGGFGLAALSLLHRMSRLVTALNTDVTELGQVLDALCRDPALRRYSTFPVLLDIPPHEPDPYRMLDAPDPASGLWLTETLVAVFGWLRDSGFTGDDLATLAAEDNRAERGAVRAALLARLDGTALTEKTLVSDRFGDRAARVLYDALVAHAGVTSARDSRLLRLDPAALPDAAADALAGLGVVTSADFLGLGHDDVVAAKLFTNLVLHGYLAADGTVMLAAVPSGPAMFATDFEDYQQPLFDLVRSLWPDTDSTDSTDADTADLLDPDVPVFLYPSDLAQLTDDADLAPLDPVALAELYDNLIYHGYLDPSGEVLDRELFADPDNADAFLVNAGLDDLASPVGVLLRARLAAFAATPVALSVATFAALPLDEDQVAALLANLTFNGYRDDAGNYRNAAAIAALRPADLALAPDWEPYWADVLSAMQDQLAAAQATLCAIAVDDLRPVADAAFAAGALAAVDDYLVDGWVQPDLWAALADRSTGDDDLPPLAEGIDPAEADMVLDRLATVVADQAPYHVDPAAFADLGLTDLESVTLLEFLIETGDLDERMAIPRERLDYFAASANAVGYLLPGFADYAREVFALLHGAAVATTAATVEIVAAVTDLAERQQAALFSAAQDAFGLPPQTLASLGRAVCGDPADALEVLLGAGAREDDPHVRLTYRRLRGFATVAARLGLSAVDVTVAFADQDLVGKYPEPLSLPPGVDHLDALLESADGTVSLFVGALCHRYAAGTYAPLDLPPIALAELSPALAPLTVVDAAFARPDGTEWLTGRDGKGAALTFVRRPHGIRWGATAQNWGAVRTTFADPDRIDAAFVDEDGRIYLFSGDQYVRYTGPDLSYVDEGYPRPVAEWWTGERGPGTQALPAPFATALSAGFRDQDGVVHLFAGDQYLAVGEDGVRPVAEVWGRVPAPFTDHVDAAYHDGSAVYLFGGDLVVRHEDDPENAGLRVADGYPRRIATHFPGVPAGFDSGLDAVLRDAAGAVHLFKDGRTVTLGDDPTVVPAGQRWGRQAPVFTDGRVDSVLAGLDGHTYLFSGPRYVRYSGTDYSLADLGYPRAVTGDWGGLRAVGVSFVLDGCTYLFGPAGDLFDAPLDWVSTADGGRLSAPLRGRFAEHGITFPADAPVTANESADGTPVTWRLVDEQGAAYTVRQRPDRLTAASADDTRFQVRYSTRDYTVADAGYPRPLSEDWWNLPEALGAGLADVDSVFTARDGQTYLFVGERFVVFDSRRRWWSEPRTLRDDWDSLPFDRVDAAFLGRDGRTYVFSADRYVRYSTADLTRLDERHPTAVANLWGRVPNRLARTGQVDASLVHDAVETVDGVAVNRTYTYLFSGDQYVRYLGTAYDTVQDGYPKPLAALATEPGMAALAARLDHVDAAFADRRSAHLLSGTHWHVVSDVAYRSYPDVTDVRCAFVEDGRLLVEGEAGWRHIGSPDAPAPMTEPARPRVLRTVPERFRTGLDAVLAGTDGNTYLFQGDTCFDVELGQHYPVARTWGIPRDNITNDGVVDAAFLGRDGITYLFRDDQFVSFAASHDAYAGREATSGPWPVAAHWGGLTNVALAYVVDGTTVLVEQPDADGLARCVVYSGPDYRTPDPGYPAFVDAGFPGAPSDFSFPCVVFQHGGGTILLSDESFTRRTDPTGAWSPPQPLNLLWPGYGQGSAGIPEGAVLRTAFTGRDGATHVFFTPDADDDAGDHYARLADDTFGTPSTVRETWAHPAFTTVDAAYVDPAGNTFVFSGERYARYGATGYRDADDGYPKPIAGNLRAETAFAGLAESFEDSVAVRGVDAVLGDDRAVFVFAGGTCQVGARALYAERDLGQLGRVRNEIAERGRVDAALRVAEKTFLFSGDQYVRYTDGAIGPYVDDGYPRTIEDSLAADLGLPELPVEFRDGIDAAARDADGGVHVFHGKDYLRADLAPAVVRPVATVWGHVRSEFGQGLPLDAAFTAPAGELYVFRGDQYCRYSGTDLTLADPGFPRTISDDWGDLPPEFEAGIDGAFRLGGATYLLCGGDYVRYSGTGASAVVYRAVDRTFPQPLAHRFTPAADYRLSDLLVLSHYAALARSSGGGLGTLLAAGPAVADPFQSLADLFGWDVTEIRWAQRNHGFLTDLPGEEDRVEIELVLRLADLFTLAARLRVPPSRLHDAVWRPAYGPTPDLDAATDGLLTLLAETMTAEDLETFTERLHDELAQSRRNALVSAVLAPDPAPLPSTLFDRLLLDVDTGTEGMTSRIREAIGAAQLYLNRYLLDLEQTSRDAMAEDTRERVRRWWPWLGNYRTWEANRKVFLYPENYLRPELRSTRTSAFRQLLNDLLQSGITTDTAQAAYKRYLDEYTEVSRLAIAGGFTYLPDPATTTSQPGERTLLLFGRTRTSPSHYYWRSAVFADEGDVSWEAWSSVDVQINADRVYPVFAFGRIFVFWATAENAPTDPTDTTVLSTTTDGAGNQTIKSTTVSQLVRVYYSFRTLTEDWVPAQQLDASAAVSEQLKQPVLAVRLSTSGDWSTDHPAIVVSAHAVNQAGEERASFATALTPELYTVRQTGSVTVAPSTVDATDVTNLFGATEAVTTEQVVWFGSPEDFPGSSWLSVDHKGSSFLCRPATVDTGSDPVRAKVSDDSAMPAWSPVNAAVQLPDGSRLCFGGDPGRYLQVKPDGSNREDAGSPISTRWGARTGSLTRQGTVDACLYRDGGAVVVVFAGDQYLRYSGFNAEQAAKARPDAGYPRDLATNDEGLPRWEKIDYACRVGEAEYFFSLAQHGWASSANPHELHPFEGEYDNPLPTKPDALAAMFTRLTRGGGPHEVPVVPNPPVDLSVRWSKVDAALLERGHRDVLYLTNGARYVRYTLAPDGTVPAEPDNELAGTLPLAVTALFQQDGSRFAVSGDTDAPLLPVGDPLPAAPFGRSTDRWVDLPAGINGAFDGTTELGFFLGDDEWVSFPRQAQPDQPARPVRYARLKTRITRLTTTTAYRLTERLLTGGVPALLDTSTQEIPELPSFSTSAGGPTTVLVRPDRVEAGTLPSSAYLDFGSANGIYYWEIFFHAPLLIAGALNTAQRFDEARTWFEYVFDPTRPDEFWRFLPFLDNDPAALAQELTERLDALSQAGVEVSAVYEQTPDAPQAPADLRTVASQLTALAPVFLGVRDLGLDAAVLTSLSRLAVTAPTTVAAADAAADLAALREAVALAAGLGVQYGLRGSAQGLLNAYQNDPFDPHAIAALRTVAYRRATVMSYVDNLVDWADLLFRQYTPEGIDEARMLYALAQDLLGPRPDSAGPRPLPADLSYGQLSIAPSPQDGPVTSDELAELTAGGALLAGEGAVHRHIVDDYFFVPANSTLTGYWDLIADRLGKIRHSLDILGVSRPVPLFAPPLDPMALVRSVATGGSVAAAVQAADGPVPHYRFAVLFGRAQDLTDRVRQFGQDLLSALAQQDAERLSLLQNRQEGDILAITLAERQAQLDMAKAGLDSATAAHASAVRRHDYYQSLLDNGLSVEQTLQIGLLSGATALQSIAAGLRVGAALATGAPQVLVGPFIMGTMEGGPEIGGALNEGAGVMDSAAQALSTGAEIAAIAAETRQNRQEWQFQVDLAGHDIDQLTAEIATARGAIVVAQRELDLLKLQISQQAEVAAFLRGKFSSAELYQWMADQLGGLYFQAYGLAVDTARAAERAYRFERGVPEGDVSFIQFGYWDDRRHGMLAADRLAVDLTRMAAAYQDTNSRGLEITKRISLRELDPLALLRLRATGGCEISLTEDLFDRDFPGHYRRQVRTVSVSCTDDSGAALPVSALLTQTTHRTVLTADQKAVRYLLDPTGPAPATVRVDWRADQQIALSDVPDGYENNGLFNLSYDDDRYLPFEGTGAVSSWQLDLTGQQPADGLPADVVITLRYTAESGGDVFTTAVRGMLRPRTAAHYLDAATDFPAAWQAFTSGSTPSLVLPITPDDLPGLSGRQITGVQAVYQLADPSTTGNPRVLVGGDPALALTGGTMLPTPGFALPTAGLTLTPAPDTDPGTLADLVLVLTYRTTS